MNNVIIKKDGSGYAVFIQSNEIDAGTFKTSYIYLGHTGPIITTAGTAALSLRP